MAVVQAVLLFGSGMWVMTPQLEKPLEVFNHHTVQWMALMGPKCLRDGTCLYTFIGAALEMVKMEDIRVYIARLQNTVAQYIATRPIMDLCLAA